MVSTGELVQLVQQAEPVAETASTGKVLRHESENCQIEVSNFVMAADAGPCCEFGQAAA